MAGERGSVEIATVAPGRRIELAKVGTEFHDGSGIMGVVLGRDEEGIKVRIT